jgi:hypothetical protein
MGFKKIRLMNWVWAALIFLGSITIFFKSYSLMGFFLVLSILLLIFAIPAVTAVSLGSESLVILGSTILISDTHRIFLRKVAWYLNLILIAYLFFGIVLFMFSGELYQTLLMAVFSVPSLLNLMALDRLKKETIK